MPEWMLQGLMTNLRTWMEIWKNAAFCQLYSKYYDALEKQLKA